MRALTATSCACSMNLCEKSLKPGATSSAGKRACTVRRLDGSKRRKFNCFAQEAAERIKGSAVMYAEACQVGPEHLGRGVLRPVVAQRQPLPKLGSCAWRTGSLNGMLAHVISDGLDNTPHSAQRQQTLTDSRESIRTC